MNTYSYLILFAPFLLTSVRSCAKDDFFLLNEPACNKHTTGIMYSKQHSKHKTNNENIWKYMHNVSFKELSHLEFV